MDESVIQRIGIKIILQFFWQEENIRIILSGFKSFFNSCIRGTTMVVQPNKQHCLENLPQSNWALVLLFQYFWIAIQSTI
jgi:hypothetical protein